MGDSGDGDGGDGESGAGVGDCGGGGGGGGVGVGSRGDKGRRGAPIMAGECTPHTLVASAP